MESITFFPLQIEDLIANTSVCRHILYIPHYALGIKKKKKYPRLASTSLIVFLDWLSAAISTASADVCNLNHGLVPLRLRY